MNTAMTIAATGLVVVCVALASPAALAQESKSVIGPSNMDLHAGAELLKDGQAAAGLERTLKGLEYATTPREKVAGMSNACAAYVMLGRYEDALPWCDRALEISGRNWRALVNRSLAYLKLGRIEEAEADLILAEEEAPGARSVKHARSIYLDVTDPVAPHVIIDDRRQTSDAETP
ncbi:MAG: tetratricopeptide repeat protein [Woeseiaceae bacterium]|nr:tetratricopeptide repeat protein [Woeseiaceae bacterium]